MKVLITGGTGYIGSALRNYLNSKMDVVTVDLEEFSAGFCNYKINFNDLSLPFLLSFNVIIHLAGHSSVAACDQDPSGSFLNNCIYFPALVGKLASWQKLIYASSASVYGASGEIPITESAALPEAIKPYDQQKQLIDRFMSTSPLRWYGLRFGTVCGQSPVPRNELLINSMVRSALRDKVVKVAGSGSYRAVLGMADLCRAIEAVIVQDRKPGYYNLASFNAKIGELGALVADQFNADLQSQTSGGSPYSFCLDTNKFQKEFDFTFKDSPADIAEAAAHNDLSVERTWLLKSFQPA